MIASPFGSTEFRALWSAELGSILGDQLARVALSLLVFDRTGSAAATATTYALTMLPSLASGALLGGLADKFPRRLVMVVCDLTRAVLIAAMAVPAMPLPVLAALLVAAQLASAPFSSAQGATLPLVLPGDLYPMGQTVRQITHQAATVAGFAGGGLLVVALGPNTALAIDAATFALSAAVIGLGVRPRPAPLTGTMTKISAGARLIWSDRRLRVLALAAWLAGFSVVPEGLAAPFAAQSGANPALVGVLMAADPVGAVLGGLWLARVPPQERSRLMGPMMVGTSLPLVGYLAGPPVAVAVVLLALSGVCSAYQITAGSTFVRLVPDDRRGQALGFAAAGLVAAQGVGIACGGVLAQGLGSASGAIFVAGAAGTLGALAAAAAWSGIRT